MSCCNLNTDQNICPGCNSASELIGPTTLNSLLSDELIPTLKENTNFSYCSNSKCDIVYYSPTQIFKTDNLKVPVFHKDPGLDVPVCYCFNVTRRAILNDIKSEGRTSVVNEIKAKMKKPGCFCEQRNPQGKCCLTDVEKYIKELLK